MYNIIYKLAVKTTEITLLLILIILLQSLLLLMLVKTWSIILFRLLLIYTHNYSYIY